MSKRPARGKGQKMAGNKNIQAVNPVTAPHVSSPTGLHSRISYKNALILITICSLVMAGLTAFQYGPAGGWMNGILYGLLFGVMVWGVFFLSLLFFRWLRNKQGL